MRKKVLLLLCTVVVALLLSACGRNDITLTVNNDGSIDAEIMYGINKSLVANDDVLKQVSQLITQSLDENNIKYTQKDSDDFYHIIVKKSFKNAAALTDEAQWNGIAFVPKFTSSQMSNAITVTVENGKINFKGTLNSDSFEAAQILSDNKKAFGASVTIKAKKAKANIKETKTDSYKWEGTAEDTVELELSAQYKGDELKPTAPNAETTEEQKAIPTPDESLTPSQDNSKSAANNTQASSKSQTKKHSSIPLASCIGVVIILLLLIAYKIKKLKTMKKKTETVAKTSVTVNEQQKGDDETCR